MAKISIIVPVYNAEKTVSGTLDSLIAQTHEDLEVLCIDDGSVDNSARILNAYARDDGRIRVFSQENQGVSVARNVGLQHATGIIIMFVDADDALVPSACAEVDTVFSDCQTEVFTFGFMCDPPELTPLGMNKDLMPPEKTYCQFEPSLLFEDHARPYMCRTAVSRELIERERIRFEPGIALGEDQIPYFLLYPFSKKTVLKPDQLYVYRMSSESATHASTEGNERLLKKILQHFLVVESVLRMWAERDMNQFCAEYLLEWIIDFLAFDINNLPRTNQHELFGRLMDDLDGYYIGAPEAHAKRAPTRRCLGDIRKGLAKRVGTGNTEKAPFIGFVHLGEFYLMRYGLMRCIQQVLIGLGILKKWK